MCGITGFYDRKNSSDEYFKTTLTKMNNALSHRGPDGEGIWFDEVAGLGLGHKRLSIIDLSEHGSQPMTSKNGNLVIIFNGEIYNHKELRADLRSVNWSGTSDTETLIECISVYGLEKSLSLIRGMFAFVLWDKQSGKITLARDRYGEKPLYYGLINNTFMFASELKSLRRHPAFDEEIDRDSLSSFLKFSYVPSPSSIFRKISKLEQGSYLVFDTNKVDYEIYKYWDLKSLVRESISEKPFFSEDQAVKSLDSLLNEVVKEQMISDVPLGAFLSGGIDSAAIVSIMQSQSSNKIKTFTIGFEDKNFDESYSANLISQYLGTDHNQLIVSADDLLAVVPNIHRIYDEPFADSSQIPTYLISKLASNDVKVTLSGDAGDEIFSGYNRYRFAKNVWPYIKAIPYPVRSQLSKVMSKISAKQAERLFSFFPSYAKNFSYGSQKLYKFADILESNSLDSYYDKLTSQTLHPSNFLKDKTTNFPRRLKLAQDLDTCEDFERLMIYDALEYLPDDILVKLDRASMNVSLESRVPFLDPRISEFAWKLPHNLKIRGSTTKYILREVLKKYLPENSIQGPKMGFSIPLDSWLRGPLRSWSEDLLDRESIIDKGYLDYENIIPIWKKHKKGEINAGPILWNILMFQLWVENL